MQNNTLLHARRICLGLAAVFCLGFLTGCDDVRITSLTPDSLPENPSHIYTITVRITTHTKRLVAGSVRPQIVIDGRNFPMQPSALGGGIYEFDYQLGPGRTEFAYYVLASYQLDTDQGSGQREAYTGVQRVNIASRYVLSLEAHRGPVGARISVLGRGFSPQDVIHLDDMPARTIFDSASSLSFFVPAVEANRNYNVSVQGSSGRTMVGSFRVDPSNLSVTPSSLILQSGEVRTLTFTLPSAAPTGGLLIDVTTDVPDSVIMPEVVIPAGSNTLTINVQGGAAGTGSLYLRGFGAGELNVPITVTAGQPLVPAATTPASP